MTAIGRIDPLSARIVTPAAAVTPFPRRAMEPPASARILDDVPYTVDEPVEAPARPSAAAYTRSDCPPPRGTTARAAEGRTAFHLAALRAYLPQPDYRGIYIDVRV